MTRNYEFSLFALGADLTSASIVEQLERTGFTHPAAAADAGIQALTFVRAADRLADAVNAVAAEAEQIEGVSIAREARTGTAVPFDPLTLDAMSLSAPTAQAATAATASEAPLRASARDSRSPGRRPKISLN